MKDFDSELTKNNPSPRIGMSHGGLRDFSSELTKNTPHPELLLLMEDFRTLHGTGVWRLIAVFPVDTVSFGTLIEPIWHHSSIL